MKIKRIAHCHRPQKHGHGQGRACQQAWYRHGIRGALAAHATTLAMFPVGETYLELLQSDKADSGTNKWIAERGEGLFHICLEVDDIDASMRELRQKGIRFETEQPLIGHGNCRIVFMDPATTGGLVIELAEQPKAGAA
jgi:methylmalonyl-CoA/ethylmalonyl-CoA epimerase